MSRGDGAGQAGLFPWAAAVGAWAVLVNVRVPAGPFLRFDDPFFILRDRAIRTLDLSSLAEIFTRPYFANYHPLTRLSFALDRDVWGFRPFGFHLTSLLLYGIGAALVFFLMNRLLRHRGAALLAALLFAGHPAHVEVTAWISARKDVLCLVFGMLALLLHCRRRETERFAPGLFAGALLCTLLAGLSKSLAVVLPVLFLVLDGVFFRVRKAARYAELLPFFAAAFFVGLMNVHAQAAAGAIKPEPLPLLGAARIFFDYLWKTVWPVHLSARYVYDPAWAHSPGAYLGAFLFAALPVAALLACHRGARLPALAYVFFLVPLLPVSNLLFPLSTPLADRYLLWPTLGWALAAGGVIASARAPRWKGAAAGAAALLVMLYGGLTFARTGAWLSDRALWEDALRENPGNWFALDALGETALREGRTAEARALFERALAAGGARHGPLFLDYGRVFMEEGRAEEALRAFRTAWELMGEGGWLAYRAAYNTGTALTRLGRPGEAVPWFERALALVEKTQDSPLDIFLGLGKALYDAGRYARAEEVYGRACTLAPRDPRPRFYRGLAVLKQGRAKEAAADFEAALGLHRLPEGASFSYADVHLMLGKVYREDLGREERALFHFRKVLELAPRHAQAEAVRALVKYLSRRVEGKEKNGKEEP